MAFPTYPWWWLGGAILASVFVVVVANVLLRTVVKRRMKRDILEATREPAVPRCYKCGYDMRGQRFPRCPECGALLGFTVSIDELPLTEEEWKAMDEKCRNVRCEDRQSQRPIQSPGPGDA